MKQLQNTVQTYEVSIYIAGSIPEAEKICQKYVDEIGLCVTIEPVKYIYTQGNEEGMRVGLIRYPRFPRDSHIIRQHALDLADLLREGLNQKSYTVITPDESIWNSNVEIKEPELAPEYIYGVR